jgi:hypothetical protein
MHILEKMVDYKSLQGWKLDHEQNVGVETENRLYITWSKCVSTTFPLNGVKYSRVCGKIIGYQYGQVDAFEPYYYNHGITVDGQYIDGVILTYGQIPRKRTRLDICSRSCMMKQSLIAHAQRTRTILVLSHHYTCKMIIFAILEADIEYKIASTS